MTSACCGALSERGSGRTVTFHYQAYGHALVSDLPLAELDPFEGSGSLPTIRIEAAQVLGASAPLRYECLWPSGARYFVSYGNGSRYVLNFPDVCDVAVDVDRLIVQASPMPDVAAETIRHILLDQVIPRLVAATGRIVLHASAVSTPVGAVAFLGEGGVGKSTLAAAFSTAGDALVCDDALVIAEGDGRPWATPSYPGLRLFPDVARQFFGSADAEWPLRDTMKWSVRPPLQSHGPTPLRHVFVLDGQLHGTAPRLEPLGPTEAFFSLLRHAYRLDAMTPAILRRDTNLYADLTSRCPVSRLIVPDQLGSLSNFRDWLFAMLEPSAVCATATATP